MAVKPPILHDKDNGPCTLPPGCEQWRTTMWENLRGAMRYLEGHEGLNPDTAWPSVISQVEKVSVAIGKIEQVRREQEILNDS